MSVAEAPRGLRKLLWVGPGISWMLSAAGAGVLLFTPRVAALYGYALVWALLLAVTLKWFISREIGRFTVCTGATILDGFARLPGPRSWALWVILLPQLIVAVATTAGMAGAAASGLVIFTGLPPWAGTITVLAAGAALLVLGGYAVIDKLAAGLGVLLALAVLGAAISVAPDPAAIADGLRPQLPETIRLADILPWLGFVLAGAAGLVWFSYGLHARGYGAAGRDPRGWLSLMTTTNTLAVVGALAMAFAVFVLGAELLHPEGYVLTEERIVPTLGRLLGDVWGGVAFWAMLAAVSLLFISTTLAVQHGFSRMFADGTRLLASARGAHGRWHERRRLERLFGIVLVGVIPIAVSLLAGGKPIALLALAGGIEAAHIPIVAVLTLWANQRMLPRELRPSKLSVALTVIAALCFGAFAVLYLVQLAA